MLLRGYRIKYSSEKDIATGIEKILRQHSVPFTQEVPLGKGSRLDVLAGDGVGIEIKVDGSNSDVIRQLHRYAGFDEVKGLILYTTRSRHRAGMPDTMQGKPLRVIVLTFL